MRFIEVSEKEISLGIEHLCMIPNDAGEEVEAFYYASCIILVRRGMSTVFGTARDSSKNSYIERIR
jgi:hypothetical protein